MEPTRQTRIAAALAAAFLAATGASAAIPADARGAQAQAALNVYPKESLAAGEQGVVAYHVVIDSRGHATDCEVTGSSGHPRLDLATCQMLMDKARFTPSTDRRGRRARSTYDGKVVWRIS